MYTAGSRSVGHMVHQSTGKSRQDQCRGQSVHQGSHNSHILCSLHTACYHLCILYSFWDTVAAAAVVVMVVDEVEVGEDG